MAFDAHEEKEVIQYKNFRICPIRTYPTFTGWWCGIYRDNQKYLCYQTNWDSSRGELATKEEAIEAAKADINDADVNELLFIKDPWF